MKGEVSDTAMLAVTIIALALVVSIGFGLFQYARSILNQGSGNLTASLDSVGSAKFSDYDQTTVTSNQINAAIQNFDGTAVAILLRTKAYSTAGNRLATDAVKEDGTKRYCIGAYATKDDGTAGNKLQEDIVTITGKKTGAKQDLIWFNYNAILKTNSTATVTSQDTIPSDAANNLLFESGTYYFSNGFYVIDGVVQYYRVYTNTKTTGMTEYVAPGTRWESNLIKDNTGSTIGIVFTQTK